MLVERGLAGLYTDTVWALILSPPGQGEEKISEGEGVSQNTKLLKLNYELKLLIIIELRPVNLDVYCNLLIYLFDSLIV